MLPVEQYFVLDPKQIAHLGGNRFVLTVPRINVSAQQGEQNLAKEKMKTAEIVGLCTCTLPGFV